MENSKLLAIIAALAVLGMIVAASDKLNVSNVVDLNTCNARYKTILPTVATKSPTICDQLCASHCSIVNMKYSCTKYFKKGEKITDEYYLRNMPSKAKSKGVTTLQPVCICGCE